MCRDCAIHPYTIARILPSIVLFLFKGKNVSQAKPNQSLRKNLNRVFSSLYYCDFMIKATMLKEIHGVVTHEI